MRIVALFITLFALDLSLFSQDSIPKGIMELEVLQKPPYSSWFVPEYDHYKLNVKALNRCRKRVNDKLRVIIFMGTWCSDSRREVPRFYKVLDNLVIPEVQTKLIFVDRSKDDGNGEATKYQIVKVPTFIITNERGKELGRIVESPAQSLEKDICRILNGEEGK
ncbi:MAG: thioredoxin family protein [Chitinophagales bacterium]|nr:thioredoxin family protein [Chitinophagales bacterium]